MENPLLEHKRRSAWPIRQKHSGTSLSQACHQFVGRLLAVMPGRAKDYSFNTNETKKQMNRLHKPEGMLHPNLPAIIKERAEIQGNEGMPMAEKEIRPALKTLPPRDLDLACRMNKYSIGKQDTCNHITVEIEYRL